jgi:thiamine biosynthesis protein ThiS
MRIFLNGQEQEVPDGCDVHALLRQCQLTPDKVAVELNRRLLRSEKYAAPLHDGDQVEIVTFVGGGA